MLPKVLLGAFYENDVDPEIKTSDLMNETKDLLNKFGGDDLEEAIKDGVARSTDSHIGENRAPPVKQATLRKQPAQLQQYHHLLTSPLEHEPML